MTKPSLHSDSRPGDRCLNCSAPLTGKYCAVCGQAARLPSLAFGSLCRGVAAELWNFDSRLWHSLLPLLFRPGQLTTAYRKGQRVGYLSPLKLYLVFSLLFFLFAALTDSLVQVSVPDPPAVAAAQLRCEAILEGAGSDWLRSWRPRAVRACQSVTADRGRSLQQAAADNVPVMMVIFIPVLALAMRLLYRGSTRYYAEHLVFFLHFHAFGFLLLTVYLLYYLAGNVFGHPGLGLRFVAVGITAWLSVYLLLAMRRVYRQGWALLLIKYSVVYFVYLAGLSISLTIVVFFTALTL